MNRRIVLAGLMVVAFSLGCKHDSSGPNGGGTGTISGTVASPQAGPLAGATVTAAPSGKTATTAANGTYSIAGVPLGQTTISVSSLPFGCTAPTSQSVTSIANQTATVNFTVTCAPTTGAIAGTVSSSLGGTLSGVGVTVTPTGGTARPAVVTSASGTYNVTGIPVGTGTGTVAFSSLPANCSVPAPLAYNGLIAGGSITVNATVTCTPTGGTVQGAVSSSLGGGLAGVTVHVTPTVGTAPGAVATGAGGTYSVTGVPIGPGTGTVTVSGLPNNCTAPPAANYSGLSTSTPVTINILVTCSAGTGTIAGQVVSSLGGGLNGVSVVVTPTGGVALAAATTSNGGLYSVPSVPATVSTGTIVLSNVPANCTAPGSTAYNNLTANTTVVVNITVTCTPTGGTVQGVVTSSLGGGLNGVSVVVTPSGGSPLAGVLTQGAGNYSVINVPAGSGTVSVSNLPGNCSAAAPVPYSGLTGGGSLTVNITVTCSNGGGGGTGTVQGTVSSSLGGGLSGVTVVVTPTGGAALPSVATSGTGSYTVPAVPATNATGTVALSGLPANCTAPPATAYNSLTAGGTVTVDITVTCVAPVGTVQGNVTSSLGGGLGGVTVQVTPATGTVPAPATTSAGGGYSVGGVPTGSGSVTLSGLPANCSVPAATPYSGLTAGGAVTVDIVVTCSGGGGGGSGTIQGTVSSSLGGGLDNVTVVVTPSGGSALPAVLTAGGGLYTVAAVPVTAASGTVSLSNLPANCTTPGPVAYNGLTGGGSVTVDIMVTCVPPIGTVHGTVSSSLGGGLDGVSVVVTPTGGAGLTPVVTAGGGAYSVSGVPTATATGTVSLSGLPSNCTAPAPAGYSGLVAGGQVTVDITVTCQPATGTIVGTVSSSLGGGLAGVSVVVTPTGGAALPAATTATNGSYTVAPVPAASTTGTVALSNLPANCTVPASPAAYNGLSSGGTVTVNITVTCTATGGTVQGVISSSLGGGLDNVTVTVTPTGGTAQPGVLSHGGGQYSVLNVPPGTGAVAVSGVPSNCTVPAAANYGGLTGGGSVTVNVTVTCSPVGGGTGTVKGTISSSLGGGLDGVSVVVTPTGGAAQPAVTTANGGAYSAAAVPVANGSGQVALGNLPANCTVPPSTAYNGLIANGTVTVDITVSCTPTGGTVHGTVTSSLGGTLDNVTVVVTPSGGSSLPSVLTQGGGQYSVSGVPTGNGNVTLSNLPANCTVPPASAYTGLTNGGSLAVNVTVICSAGSGQIIGTVSSSLGGGLNGVTVVVTPTGLAALPAVTTAANGAYTVTGVPASVQTGSVTLSGVPANCSVPTPQNYTGLLNGATLTVDFTVSCVPTTGTLTGTVTSSLGAPVRNVSVVVTPSGGVALPAVLTAANGSYTVTNVPAGVSGSGGVTLAGLTVSCTPPPSTPYAGLAVSGSLNVDVTVTCTPLTVTSTAPGAGATGVEAGALVQAVFSAALDTVTITPTSFTLTTGGLPVVSGTGFGAGATTVTSVLPLLPGATYQGTVSTAVTDAVGIGLATPFQWSFSTRAMQATAIDQVGDVGQYTAMARQSNGRLHVTYYDNTGANLKYATCDGSVPDNCSNAGNWQIGTVDTTGDVGKYSSSIVVEANGRVDVSYYNNTFGFGDLKFATCAANCSVPGNWTRVTVDATGDVGFNSSLVKRGNGPLRVVYFDLQNGDLKYATCSNTCTSAANWTRTVVDNGGGAGVNVGAAPSLGEDAGGRLHVSYANVSAGARDLRYATCAASCGTAANWSNVTVDATLGVAQNGTSLVVDTVGDIHIAYDDGVNNDIKYATCAAGTICTVAANWQTVAATATGNVGHVGTLSIDSNGRLHVFYDDQSVQALGYATCAAACTSTASWQHTTVDPAFNVGTFMSSAIDPAGRLHVVYYDAAAGDLKYAE